MLFSKITGHSDNLKVITNQIAKGSFEGVYLFHGPQSIGKYTIANNIAKYLSCTGVMDDTCRCENCRLFPNVPDYLNIDKEDKMITVDDIKPLNDFLSLVSFRGKHRVAIINNVHNVNTTSANNLLKILEEIPPKCVVILITNNLANIIPTIVSRCYQMEFKSLNSEELKVILKNLGYPSSSIAEIDRMIPFLSKGVLSNLSRYLKCINLAKNFLKDLSNSTEDDIITLIREINEEGNLDVFMEILLILINDIMKIRLESPDSVCCVRHIDYLEDRLEDWSSDLCIYMIAGIRKTMRDMDRKIHLKIDVHFLPNIMWAYYFINKKKK